MKYYLSRILCFIIGHKWESMKDVPNPRFHDCEWCPRCMYVKDFSKMK